MNKLLVVCGATASGKSGFAVEIAKRLKGEVVSADCMCVYKHLNIGTAKPTRDEMCGVVHHLIDVVEPYEQYSVSDYESEAVKICQDILNRNCVPVVCGGTGFYIQSLLFCRTNGGIGADSALRSRLQKIADERGNEYLHAMLALHDQESADKLHPNDVKRVIRALEIYMRTGKPKSQQKDGVQTRFPYLAVAFDYPRDELYERINARVDVMISNGLVEEVEKLLDSGVSLVFQCMQGIGYKEVIEYLNNRVSYSTMCDKIKQNTRNYAKRQITFFKKLPDLVWLDPKQDNIEKVVNLYYEY